MDDVYLCHITVSIRYDIILARRSVEEFEEVFDSIGLIKLGLVKILNCLDHKPVTARIALVVPWFLRDDDRIFD